MLTACSHKETGRSVVQEHQFNRDAKIVQSLCNQQQKLFIQTIDAIASTRREQANFQNTMAKLERAKTEFTNTVNPLVFLKYVSPNAEVRSAANKCEVEVEKLNVDIYAREDLFAVIKATKENKEPLNNNAIKLMEEYMRDFRRNGLELPLKKRKVFIKKKKELVSLESQFSKNLLEWKDHLEVSRKELEGMDDGFIKALEQTKQGKYKVTLAYPHYFPFMRNAVNADTRRRLQLKFQKRGGRKNLKILERALKLRYELARMLGKPTHADFVLEKQMVKNSKTALNFLNDLAKKLKSSGKKDLQEMLVLKRKELKNPKINKIHSHDWRYYANLLKKKKHEVDSQLIKEYFPLDTVLKGMMEIYQTLLGINFVIDKEVKSWHASVRRYFVQEKGNTLAILYMDLFPREGKYGHAAAFYLLNGYELEDGSYSAPVSAIVANFTTPTKENPSLLTHSQVETLFHEFGHVVHQLLTKVKYGTFSGTHVKRDFVEAPSQMLENWCWKKESLTKLSGHYKDSSKKLPDDQIKKLIDARLANAGIIYLHQLMLGLLDLTLHTSAKVDSTKVYKKLANNIMMVSLPNNTYPQASFGHLMWGYDAGYYGYLWAKVYAEDMYTRFEKEGLLNPSTGKDYRKWILEPGGEKEPMDLVKGFLGREPNSEAFLKSIGL